MDNTKMGDHLASIIYFCFGRNIRQIRQIYQFNRNLKNSIMWGVTLTPVCIVWVCQTLSDQAGSILTSIMRPCKETKGCFCLRGETLPTKSTLLMIYWFQTSFTNNNTRRTVHLYLLREANINMDISISLNRRSHKCNLMKRW